MSEPVTMTYAVSGRVARITLDLPERGNGIPRRLVSELERCVERADLDPGVHVILLAGNGKGFCGGYDLVESAEGQGRMGEEGFPSPPGSPLDPMVMAANHDPAGTWDPMVDYGMMGRNVRAFMSLFHCSKPVVCKDYPIQLDSSASASSCPPLCGCVRRRDWVHASAWARQGHCGLL
jgi:enoyl-CoA hydratase